jgi:3-methyladenine DNA glycosylase/8-oxoguanine DNA glycosylase
MVNRKACEYLSHCDSALAPWIERIGPIKHKARRLPPFHSLIRAIIHQQLSGTAAGTILGRFQALFSGGDLPTPEQVLAMPPETLRSAGLSRAKLAYILDLAAKAREGLVPALDEVDDLTDEELLARLTEIKGVGRWTVEMMLIFDLGRPDVLPIHDLSIRKGFKAVFRKRKLPEPEAIQRYGELWRPHRTTAALYLWRASVL